MFTKLWIRIKRNDMFITHRKLLSVHVLHNLSVYYANCNHHITFVITKRFRTYNRMKILAVLGQTQSHVFGHKGFFCSTN